jgi:aryl-alcohol dehydrogenase-like predicted oxidoreductase
LKKLNLNRDDFVLATKFSNSESSVRLPNNKGNSSKSIFQAVNSSLKRLDTNYIDLLYVHFWDFTTDNDHLMRSLDDLVRCGKVLNIAISDAPAWEVASCNVSAKLHGWSQFVAYQGRYSLTDRECENDLLPMCEKLKLSYIPWGVLGQGKLTGKRIKGEETKDVSRNVTMSDLDFEIQDEVIKIAKELEKTPSQVATNWMLSRPSVSSVLVGPRNYEQFEDNLKAFDFKLSNEHLERLNKVSEPAKKSIFPHTFIGDSYKNCQWLYFGEKKYQIE